MEVLVTIATGLGLAILLAPLVALLLTFFVLVPLAHLLPAPATVARETFECPFSRRRVTAAFLTAAGAEHPEDVLACSVFETGAIRCKKSCLHLAHAAWAPTAMTPRFALVADGVTLRDLAIGVAGGKGHPGASGKAA